MVALLLLAVMLIIVFGGPPDEMLENHLAGLREAFAEAQPGAQATVTLGPLLPEQMPTETRLTRATVSPTPMPTTSPTATATATHTPTPEPTQSPTLIPTEAPTEEPTPVPATATPAPTETPALEYPAPELLAPSDGFVFAGGGTEIWLRWEPVGELGEDDYYAVSLRYQKDGGTAYSGSWYKGAEWLVPEELWQQYDTGHPEYEWDVVVMRQTGTREDGGRIGVPVGEVSETRQFIWR